VYLGIDIEWLHSENSVIIRQSAYIQKLIQKFDVDISRTTRIPMEPTRKLEKAKAGEVILTVRLQGAYWCTHLYFCLHAPRRVFCRVETCDVFLGASRRQDE
jgi:hypothetical protein